MDQLNNEIQENWYSLNIDGTTVFQFESCLKDKKKMCKKFTIIPASTFLDSNDNLIARYFDKWSTEKQYNKNQLLFNAQMLVIHVFNKE